MSFPLGTPHPGQTAGTASAPTFPPDAPSGPNPSPSHPLRPQRTAAPARPPVRACPPSGPEAGARRHLQATSSARSWMEARPKGLGRGPGTVAASPARRRCQVSIPSPSPIRLFSERVLIRTKQVLLIAPEVPFGEKTGQLFPATVLQPLLSCGKSSLLSLPGFPLELLSRRRDRTGPRFLLSERPRPGYCSHQAGRPRRRSGGGRALAILSGGGAAAAAMRRRLGRREGVGGEGGGQRSRVSSALRRLRRHRERGQQRR